MLDSVYIGVFYSILYMILYMIEGPFIRSSDHLHAHKVSVSGLLSLHSQLPVFLCGLS